MKIFLLLAFLAWLLTGCSSHGVKVTEYGAWGDFNPFADVIAGGCQVGIDEQIPKGLTIKYTGKDNKCIVEYKSE